MVAGGSVPGLDIALPGRPGVSRLWLMCAQHGDGRAGVDTALVRRLIGVQFPQWRDLPIEPVEVDGWDNRTYRLGRTMSVRLPTAEGYVPAVEKERRWLPVLARFLPLSIPVEVGAGQPDQGYPHPWSVRAWLEGEAASRAKLDDPTACAVTLAEFLLALQRIDPAGGPAAGAHSFFRGASPSHYDDETRRALHALSGRVDVDDAAAVWRDALEASWGGPPVWFHGDVASGNLLVREGRLAAVIDFGTSGVGDPACDLVIAWTFLAEPARSAFRRTMNQDTATWARARGWALWKALITLANPACPQGDAAEAGRVIARVLADHRAHTDG